MINSFAPIDKRILDVFRTKHDGYPPGLAREDTRAALREACCGVDREFPDDMWIEPRDWADHARENDKNGTWGMNHVDRFTNQSPTHECTVHSLLVNFCGARNRQRGIIFPKGPVKGHRYAESAEFDSVWPSVMSVYNEANPRIWGGANVRRVLEIMCRRGALPDKTQPRDYGFKHTMPGTMGNGNLNQSKGKWVKVRDMPEGWEETAAWFKPRKVIFARTWEEVVCLLLRGRIYSVGRNGHAIPYFWLRFNSKGQLEAVPYGDSYDVIRADSLRTFKNAIGGGFCIESTTAPDDWKNPVGIAA